MPQTVGDSLIDLNERTYYYAYIDASGNITPITVNGGVSGTEYLYGTDDKTSDDATHPFNCLVNGITLYTDKDGIKYTTDDLVRYDEDGDGVLESQAR
ncbi:MAG: hypothetical protein MJ246_01995 [Clostridia bacterium]|nr:hypothetical protein [Clostridia bacterium]